MTSRRLIEETFPLKKVSEDASHEKMCHAGHIKSLHIWPARRPLAACRAAIIAALLPDPGDEQSRCELNKKIESITRWGTENGPALDFFRQEIRQAFDGRAPRVLDMFAGGGAIPLEAMRLGCDVTAIDYNPVAWFILKCTLEFPQKLAGQALELPVSKLPISSKDEAKNKTRQLTMLDDEQGESHTIAEHVRYWGKWVLEHSRAELEPYYPKVNEQSSVAYLWARTVPCPDPMCGTEVPLLKTLSLSTKPEKVVPDTSENRSRFDVVKIKKTRNTTSLVINARRALRLVPNMQEHAVNFEIWTPKPDDTVPEGTMSGAKSRCPICGVNLTPDYIKQCGKEGKMGEKITAVVVNTDYGKDYRLPTKEEQEIVKKVPAVLAQRSKEIPFGLPTEVQENNPRTLIVQLYGLNTWSSLFTHRQLLSLTTFLVHTRRAYDEMIALGYPVEWAEAVLAYLACVLNKLADYNSTIVTWQPAGEKGGHTFSRWAIQLAWDFVENNPIIEGAATYSNTLEWITNPLEQLDFTKGASVPSIRRDSATQPFNTTVDLIVTDPPYYSAIPYADLSDFFYVWLRRIIGDRYPDIFAGPTAEKSNELALRLPHIDIPDEHTPQWFEQGMAEAFKRAHEALVPEGQMVIVFAHKEPDAWETLVTAMIQAGFIVTASWPIDTEMGNRTRAMESAALASSIWLVCRKRSETAGVGRYAAVRKAMQERITERLRYFWDMGISGPDFVWAAVGPALESYSAYREVRRMDGSPFTVGEFLREVRRMVADFALGQILKGQSTEGLDEWTRYYLMHRNYFGLEEAPVGECILLSQGYGLDLNELRSARGFMLKASTGDVRLAKWDERKRDDLGEPHPGGGLPLIDMLHRLLWLWAAGDTARLRAYAADHGLGQNDLFWAIAQAVLEMADPKSRERQLLEAVVAWGRGKSPETNSLDQKRLFAD